MYIQKVEIQNIRNIRTFTWERPSSSLVGWHVLIGDNGSGKSTVLRSLALALIGEKDIAGLRQDWNSWLTQDQLEGSIAISLLRDEEYDEVSGKGKTSKETAIPISLSFERDENHRVVIKNKRERKIDPLRYVWGNGSGWFSASYGPFRRFTGGNSDYDRLFHANRRLATHLSVFGEDVALSETIEWLKELHYKQLEKRPQGDLLEVIKGFINQPDFLPHGIRFKDVSSEGVKFIDSFGHVVGVDALSDGYRSILSMTFEIIRQLQIAYPAKPLFSNDNTHIITPGVVMVDEIDVHLHPSWQQVIGRWFVKHFPNIQFIVSTHSPLVCQAVAIGGSIWRLQSPDAEQPSYEIKRETEEWKRLVYGNILEAYSTDLFGEKIDRSEEAQEKLEQVAKFSLKELNEGLSKDEEQELMRLLQDLPSTPKTHSVLFNHD